MNAGKSRAGVLDQPWEEESRNAHWEENTGRRGRGSRSTESNRTSKTLTVTGTSSICFLNFFSCYLKQGDAGVRK